MNKTEEKNYQNISLKGQMINSPTNLQESFDFNDQIEKEIQNNNIDNEGNDKKKLNDLIATELVNKMELISPIPQSNVPKRKMSGVLMMEKEDGNEYDDVDEKDEDNFCSSDSENENKNENEERSEKNDENDNNINKNKENEISHNIIKDENKNPNMNLNRTFSYNIMYKSKNNIINEYHNNSQIACFFNSTSEYLKAKLSNESFHSDINKSHNYLLKKDINNSRDNNNESNNISNHYNNLSINNESQNNDSLNFNLNSNVFFGIYNQKNLKNIDNNNINNQNLNKKNNFFNDDGNNLINSDDFKEGDKNDNLYKNQAIDINKNLNIQENHFNNNIKF